MLIWHIFCGRYPAIIGINIPHHIRIFLLSAFAMIAFAGNSLLCRLALKTTDIDAASFTTIRLVSGAVMLWFLARSKAKPDIREGNLLSAFALFVYAAGFSFAYLDLSAGMGALLLFGSVQVTMISYGLSKGERLHGLSLAGLLLALAGFVGLLLPGITAPPLLESLLMSVAGIAWGVYSLRGKDAKDALEITTGNFLRAAAIAVVFCLVFYPATNANIELDIRGVIYAVCSGAITSGLGYALWYSVLAFLKTTTAAIMQLSVPAIAALGGVLFLHESVSMRLIVASAAILGGIAMVIFRKTGN